MTDSYITGLSLLPSNVLQKASVRGREYAWHGNDIEEAINAGMLVGLANLGGQAQFHLPDNAIYDMYWHVFEGGERDPKEPWHEYVIRSATEVLSAFHKLYTSNDFLKDAQDAGYLFEKYNIAVEDALDYLCFEMSLVTESWYNTLISDP